MILPPVILVSQIQFVLLAWFKIYFLDYFALEVTSGEVLSNSKFYLLLFWFISNVFAIVSCPCIKIQWEITVHRILFV